MCDNFQVSTISGRTRWSLRKYLRALFQSHTALASIHSGTKLVKMDHPMFVQTGDHLMFPIQPGSRPWRCSGTLGRSKEYVQAIIVAKQLQSMLRELRTSGEETKFTLSDGTVQFG